VGALIRRLTVAGMIAGIVISTLGAGVVAAASAAFGQPTADARYGERVVFEQPVDLQTTPDLVEVLIDYPGALGPTIAKVQRPVAAGRQNLRYTLLIADGHLLPNTRMRAQWRLRFGDRAETGPSVSVLYADTRFDWKTRAGDIVHVHWYEGDDAFGRRALQIAEKGVSRAEDLLGVKESEPIDFFVYAAQTPFYDALGPGTRENVGGQANAEIRTMFALITPAEISDPWVDIVLPHELTHLVFNTAVKNPYHFPPRWLNEGLAVYLSQGLTGDDRALVQGAKNDGAIIPLDGLSGQFPTTADHFYLAYAESVSAVDFLVRTYGRPALVKLIRSYGEGVTDDEAFNSALGVDAAGFSSAWLAAIGASAPQRYGPQPAPAGPLPPGWSGGPVAKPSSTPVGAVGSAPPASPAPANPLPVTQAGQALPTMVVALALIALVLGVAGVALIVRGDRTRR
jgi:peptidase MA superfamily protein